MPFCTNCGQEVPDGAKFCQSCGAATSENSLNRQGKRKQIYEGEISRCPNCGEQISAFEVICHSCGFELRNRKGSNAIQDFANAIAKIEETRPPQKIAEPTSQGNKHGKKKDAITYPTVDPTDKRIANTISTFVIPNTKEDILEFIILAANNINADILAKSANTCTSEELSSRTISSAWAAKFEQAYQKAKISFGDSPDFVTIKELYENKQGEIRLAKRKRTHHIIFALLVIVAAFLIWFWAIFRLSGNDKERSMDTTTPSAEQTTDALETMQNMKDAVNDVKGAFAEVKDTFADIFE